METVLLIMEVIALGAVSSLCIYLIVVLVRVKRLLELITSEIKEISVRVLPVLANLESITDKIRSITETINEQVDTIRYSIASLKEIADSVVSFEHRVQESIEQPIMDTIETFT